MFSNIREFVIKVILCVCANQPSKEAHVMGSVGVMLKCYSYNKTLCYGTSSPHDGEKECLSVVSFLFFFFFKLYYNFNTFIITF